MPRIAQALERATQPGVEVEQGSSPSTRTTPIPGAASSRERPGTGTERGENTRLSPHADRQSPPAPVFTRFHPSVLERLVVGLHYRNKATMTMSVEQYQKLAATLLRVQTECGIKAVMITSAAAGEGKTLTAINLALTLSESCKQTVLVIDGDLDRPALHTLFQVPNLSGLSEGLQESGPPKVSPFEITRNLALLPAGVAMLGPATTLASPRMWRILQDASARFDWVIVDAPPAGQVSQVRVLAHLVDAVLLVVNAGTTDRAAAEHALQSIGRNRVLGVVLNRVAPPEHSRL